MSLSESDLELATKLFKAARIPLLTCPAALTWVLLDYFDTIQDEVKYIWPGSLGLGKCLYYVIRYYTILAVIFDVAQIHYFAKFQPSLQTCVAMDAMIRVVGAISLWTIEIVMQLRIYALYSCSKKVAVVNALLFLLSIAGFLAILIHNGLRRASVIRDVKQLPIPGCPVVHPGIEWAQWIPATVFEGVLFIFALAKSLHTLWARQRDGALNAGLLRSIIIHDNLLYFFGVSALLVLNNLMVVNVTPIPWFSYAPFHAGLGIMTTRMLLHLHKAVVKRTVVYSGGRWESTTRSYTITESDDMNARRYEPESVSLPILSTSATMSWNCGENTAFGGRSSRLTGFEERYR